MLEDIKSGSSKLDGCRPLAFIVFFREISFSTMIHLGNTLKIFIFIPFFDEFVRKK